MRLQHPLEVITPSLDGPVLNLLADVETAFTISEIAVLIPQHSRSGIKRVLERLTGQGIVTKHRWGATSGYSFNRQHVCADAVLLLAQTKHRLLEKMRREIAQWQVPAPYVCLFGSAARGDMQIDSDIDLLVVAPDEVVEGTIGGAPRDAAHADRWKTQLDALGMSVETWTGNDVQVVEMSESEAKAKWAAADPLLLNVSQDGIILAGPQNYWRGMGHG